MNRFENSTKNELSSMAAVTEAMTAVMSRHRDYYSEELKIDHGGSIRRDVLILQELAAAWQKFQNGELTTKQIPVINLFRGSQSRNPELARERENSNIIEEFYSSFNNLVGRHVGYHDILPDAQALKDRNLVVMESSPFRHLLEDTALSDDSGRLVGLQFRLTPNLVASFSIGNLGQDDPGVYGAKVDLVIYPQSNSIQR